MSDVIAVGITLDTSLAYEELSRLAAEVEGLNFTAALKVDTAGLAEARAVVKEITTAFSDMPSLSFGGVADKAIRQVEDLSHAIVALRSQLDTPLGGRGITIKQDGEEVTRMKQEQHEIDLAIKEQRLASLQATEAEREAKRAAAQEAAQAKELASFHKHVEEMRKAAEAAVNARVESERIAADALIKEQQRAAAAAKAAQENQMWSEHKGEGGSVPANRGSWESENKTAIEIQKRVQQEQALWDEYYKERSYGQSMQEPDWNTVNTEQPEVDRWEAANAAVERYFQIEEELLNESQARADAAARKDAERWANRVNAEITAAREAAEAQESGATKEALYQGIFGNADQNTVALAQEETQQEKNLDLINRKAVAEDIKNQKMNYENELIEDEENGQERVLDHMRVKTRIAQRIKDLQEQVNKELGVENRQRQASLGYAKNSFSETFRGLALIGVGMRGSNPLTMAYSVEGIIRFTQGLGKATGAAGGLLKALAPISKFIWPVAGLGVMTAGFMSLSILAPKIATSIYSITKPYAELEDLQLSFVSTFETIGPAAEKAARAFSDHFKVHIAEVYKSYTQLSMALQEKGFSEQMSLDIVGPLEERMADMGAFFVGTTEDMQKAVNSALNRQYRPLRTQAGILLNQRMVSREADRLRDQGALGSREQIEAWATIKLIMEQSAKTAGQFDRDMAAGSLKLKQQAVDTAWKDTTETFGQVLAPITKTLQDFSIVSAKEWQKWLQENATMLESLAPALRDLLTASMKFSQWVLEKTGAVVGTVVGTPYEISKAVKERQELTGESNWESIKAMMSATYDGLPEIYKKALVPITSLAVWTNAIPQLTSGRGVDLGPITQEEKELSAARAKAVQEAEDLKKAEAELEAQRQRDREGKWEGYTNEKVSEEEYQENIKAINELIVKSAEDYMKQVARGTAAWTVSSMETKELVYRHKEILEQAQYIKDTDSAIADAAKDQLAAKELYVEASKKALKLDKQLQEIYKEIPNLTLDMARFKFEQGDIAPEELKEKLRKGIDSALEAYTQDGEAMYLDIAKQYNSFLKEIQNSTEKFGNQVSVSRYSEVEAFRMSSRVWLSQGTTKIEDHTGRILKANYDMLKNQEKSLRNEEDELEELRRLNNSNSNVPGSATGLFVVAGG